MKVKKIKLKKGKHITLKKGNPYANIDWEKAAVLFQREVSNTSSHKFPPTREILSTLAKVGAIGMIFLFPGAAPALGSLVLGEKSYPRWQTKQILSQLAKRKYVTVKYHNDGKVTVKITKNGMIRALTYKLDNLELKKPKQWDSKWRVVIFDIPDKYKHVRDLFRMRLGQLGLYKFQESVYVSPYNCSKEIEFLRELYGVPFTVKYLLVEKIEDDIYLRRHFDLN